MSEYWKFTSSMMQAAQQIESTLNILPCYANRKLSGEIKFKFQTIITSSNSLFHFRNSFEANSAPIYYSWCCDDYVEVQFACMVLAIFEL